MDRYFGLMTGAPGDHINMLVPIIDGTKGRQDRCSRRAGGSRLASCLLLTAFRTRDYGKRAAHRSGSGTIGHGARGISDAYRGSPSSRSDDPGRHSSRGKALADFTVTKVVGRAVAAGLHRKIARPRFIRMCAQRQFRVYSSGDDVSA